MCHRTARVAPPAFRSREVTWATGRAAPGYRAPVTSPSTSTTAALDDPDGPRRREEAVHLAADLLRVDSTNGNETAVAEVLAEYLAGAGVTAEHLAVAPATLDD